MKTTVEVKPKRDSYNTYPPDVQFITYGDTIVMVLDYDRELAFKTEDIKKVLTIAEV